MRFTLPTLLLATVAAVAPVAAQADVRITEFMYQGASGGNREFFELTNISSAAIEITGWYFDDDSNTPSVAIGDFFGVLAANESIIVTEMTANAFRGYWGLDAAVRIFGSNTVNLGGSDTINIYSSSSATDLVDSVSYSGTTRGITRNRPEGATGTVANALFAASTVGDAYGSAYAVGSPADLGNPGRYPALSAAVPEPASWAMMIGGFAVLGAATRRRSKVAFA